MCDFDVSEHRDELRIESLWIPCFDIQFKILILLINVIFYVFSDDCHQGGDGFR